LQLSVGDTTASGRILDKIGRMKVPAMFLKYRYASGACLFLVLVLLTLGTKRVVEARFGGKGVREWIELMAADRNPDSEAARSLEKLGTRAVPYLMQEAMRTESWPLKVAAKFPPGYRDIFGDRGYARQVSACSVAMLGRLGAAERKKNENQVEQSYPIAERVVPFFIEQISVKLDWPTWITSLGEFGPRATNAVPLLKMLHSKNTSRFHRHYLVLTMKKIGYWEESFEADLKPFWE
jgi:hypothetical protein